MVIDTFRIALASFVICCLLSFCYVPYCIWIFFKDRNQQYAQKRRPFLVITLMIVVTLPSWCQLFLRDRTQCVFEFCRAASHAISDDVRTVFLYASVATMASLLSCRVWLLFYDLKHGEALLRHEWWSSISDQQDWFIQNRNRWGSLKKYLWKRVLGVCLFMYCSLIAATFITNIANPSVLVLMPFACTCVTFLVVIFCKMPKQYDALLIRKEMNRLILLYSVSTLWFIISGRVWLGSPFLSWFNAFYTYLFNAVIVALVSLWPHNQRSQQRQQQKQDSRLRIKCKGHTDAEVNREVVASMPWTSYVNACEDDRNWNRFMRHLLTGMAVESLCFVLEVIQFKKQFIKDLDLMFASTDIEVVYDEEIGWFMKLPPGLPNSSIVHFNLHYVDQIDQIADKYISDHALLPINVGLDARREFLFDLKTIKGGFASKVCEQSMHGDLVSTSTTRTDDLDAAASDRTVNSDLESKERTPTMTPLESMMQQKMVKVFDACLADVCDTLTDSFLRFKNRVGDESDAILEVMVNHKNKSGAGS